MHSRPARSDRARNPALRLLLCGCAGYLIPLAGRRPAAGPKVGRPYKLAGSYRP